MYPTIAVMTQGNQKKVDVMKIYVQVQVKPVVKYFCTLKETKCVIVLGITGTHSFWIIHMNFYPFLSFALRIFGSTVKI